VPTEVTHVIMVGGSPNACEITDTDGAAASVQVKSGGYISLQNNRKLMVQANCSPLPAGK
jgi:hypothetical protein